MCLKKKYPNLGDDDDNEFGRLNFFGTTEDTGTFKGMMRIITKLVIIEDFYFYLV